MNIQTLHKL